MDPHSSENPGTRSFQAASPPLSRNSPQWYLASGGTTCLIGNYEESWGPRGEPCGLCSGCSDLLTRWWAGRMISRAAQPWFTCVCSCCHTYPACPSLPPSHVSVRILPGPLAEKGPSLKEKTALSSDDQESFALPCCKPGCGKHTTLTSGRSRF